MERTLLSSMLCAKGYQSTESAHKHRSQCTIWTSEALKHLWAVALENELLVHPWTAAPQELGPYVHLQCTVKPLWRTLPSKLNHSAAQNLHRSFYLYASSMSRSTLSNLVYAATVSLGVYEVEGSEIPHSMPRPSTRLAAGVSVTVWPEGREYIYIMAIQVVW